MTSIKKRLAEFKKQGHGTPEQRAARLAATGGDIIVDRPQDPGKKVISFRDLQDLTNEQLVARFADIDAQATLTKWRIAWELRKRFPSNNEFGAYIEQLRNDPVHTNCVDSQQLMNRAANAGKFCERFGINSLDQIKIGKSIILELSRPIYDEISGELYRQFSQAALEGEHIKYKDAVLAIEDARKKHGIGQQKRVTVHKPDEPKQSTCTTAEAHVQSTQKTYEKSSWVDEAQASDRQALLKAFANMPILETMSDDDAIAEIKFIAELHSKRGLPAIRRNRIFKTVIDWMNSEMRFQNDYPKPISQKVTMDADQGKHKSRK